MEPFFSNIIILGSWNTKIFTPGWVGRKIYGVNFSDHDLPENKTTDETLKIGVNLEELEVRYENDEFSFIPKSNLLEFLTKKIDEITLDKVNTAMNAVLLALSETPIKGIGFNFKYHISEEFILELVKGIRSENKTGMEIKGMTFNERFLNSELTTSIYLNEKNSDVSFNFHHKDNLEMTDKLYSEYYLYSIKKIKQWAN